MAQTNCFQLFSFYLYQSGWINELTWSTADYCVEDGAGVCLLHLVAAPGQLVTGAVRRYQPDRISAAVTRG